MNKNDIPIQSIEESYLFEDFLFKDDFIKIALLSPNSLEEKIDIDKFYNEESKNKSGLVYAFVIDGKLLKIGSTTTTIEKRIQSYNCGKKKYRVNGTCSTTNYFVLQSFLLINKPIEVYGFYPELLEVDVFGEKLKTSIPPKLYEKSILKHLKAKGEIPILCTQT